MANQNDTNKVRYGLSNVHIWPKTGDTEWGEPIKIPGAVNLSMSPEGTSELFFADNGPYFDTISNNGWSGEVEIAKIPDEFYVVALGWRIDANGALVEVSDAVAKPFAFGFEVMGDKQRRRTVYFECTAQRPNDENKTVEATVTPKTEKFSINAIPVEFANGERSAKLTLPKSETNTAVYDAFFTNVVTPDFGKATE